MIRLNGRKALITGGSRGIGRAGCDVAINYQRNKAAADEVQKEVERLGRECLVYKVEISMKKDVDDMIAGSTGNGAAWI